MHLEEERKNRFSFTIIELKNDDDDYYYYVMYKL